MATQGDAQGWGYQRETPWPPMDTRGVTTVGGRTFHRDERCHGYQQGVRNSIKAGRNVNSIETLTAQEAKGRGKSACRVCWT